MATAIKSIPVLNGRTAERFVEIVDENSNATPTVVPDEMREAIYRMIARSKDFKIKTVSE